MAVGAHSILANSLKLRDQKAKRQAWAEAFSDVKYGDFPRVLEEMQETDNFYSDQITQIKLPRWSNGRCALVGDAAYAPSPITGAGTELAFLGAYVLAGELGKNISDPAAAFMAYEKKIRCYVEERQQVPLGGRAPNLVCPQTSLGIRALQTTLWLSMYTGIWKLLQYLPEGKVSLPEYELP
jgi:2-polyprenyl-6-methoxyphenol hydroxylase-like FAD-dependent oxidoreductase